MEELLEFSQAGKLTQDKETIELSQLVEEIISVINVDVNYIRIKVNFVPENIRIFDVKAHVYQVFENLISNAVKYMGDQKNPMIGIGNRVLIPNCIFLFRTMEFELGQNYIKRSLIFLINLIRNPQVPGKVLRMLNG